MDHSPHARPTTTKPGCGYAENTSAGRRQLCAGAAFAARHKCSTKKDKTKAGYWSCRLPRYAKLLGLKSNFGGFW